MLNPACSPPVYEQTPGAMQFYPANAFVNSPPAYEFIPHRVFVGGFPVATTESELRCHFEKFFRIREAKVIRSADGISKGYAFITFDTEEEAEAVKNMSPHKLEFKGRKLNLGPALRRMSASRYVHPEYAVATPTGVVQPGQVFTYPVAKTQPPFILMRPHYLPNGGFLFNHPSAYPNGQHQQLLYDHSQVPQGVVSNGMVNGMVPQQQSLPAQDSSSADGSTSAVEVSHSAPAAMNQFDQSQCQSQSPPAQMFCYPPYSYYVQPSTPITPSQAPMSRVPCATTTVGAMQVPVQMQHVPYYPPEGVMTPMSAPFNGYSLQQIPPNSNQQQQNNMTGFPTSTSMAGNCDSALVGSGDCSTPVMPVHPHHGQQHSAFMTPSTQQRQPNPPCQISNSAYTPNNLAAGCETPRTHSTAVRRINLFGDSSAIAKNEKSGSDEFTTPVRLEPRVRVPDQQHKSQAKTPAASQMMFMRTPPSDTKSLPPGRPKKNRGIVGGSDDSSNARAATSLVGQFQSLQVNGNNGNGGGTRSGSVTSVELGGEL